MLNMNTVILAGYVGADPTLKTYAGRHKLTFRMATSQVWVDERGEKHEKTDWHEIVYWGKSAPKLATMIRVGSGLLIRGGARCDEYTQDGVKKWRNYMQAAEIWLADKVTQNDEPDESYYPHPDEYHQEQPRQQAQQRPQQPQQQRQQPPRANPQPGPRNDPRVKR